jgi:PAS domain S-box-containing protein
MNDPSASNLPAGASPEVEELRDSEQRLRLAIAATGIGIWDVDAISGRRRWSPEFRTILGLPADIEPGTDVFSVCIHPADVAWVNEVYARAYASPEYGTYEAEFRIIRANDGAERWVVTTGVIYFNEAGAPIRGIGTLRDIHERRQVEEARRLGEERLRVALAAGRMGIWWSDLATGKQQWDARQYELLGVDPEIAPSRELFLSLVHPDDLAAVAFDLAAIDEPGAFFDSEFRVIKPGGEIRWITAHSVLRFDASGTPTEMIGVNWDVTREKEAEAALRVSEERHRLAIEANRLGTWDYNMVTGEHRWSSEFRQLWGLAPGDPADPKLLRPLINPKDWDRVVAMWQEASAADGRIEIEYELRRADDGVRRWSLFQGQVFFDERGKPVRAVGIMLDTTDRKQAEERQRLLLNELNHRVKNTLATVQAIVSQSLRATPDPGEAFERIQSRLMALSNTHNLLNTTSWAGARLAAVLDTELRPYRGPTGGRVVLAGEPVELDAKTALAIGLIAHELATNAVKYGSLSVPEGRIEIGWAIRIEADEPRVDLAWREHDGPAVAPPSRKGFGSRLIERSARDLLGRVDLDYTPDGFGCRLSFPLRSAAEENPAADDP